MFEIIVDSAANIPAELCKKYKIKVLSFVNLVNGKEMTCFEPDLTPEQERALHGNLFQDMYSSLQNSQIYTTRQTATILMS
jgi:fatty acid-binding protein DegV